MEKSTRSTKKKVAVTAALSVLLIGGGGSLAYAYWTVSSTSAVNSAATAASGLTNAVVTQTTPVTQLKPGTTIALTGSIRNADTSGSVEIDSLVAAVTGTSKSGCDVAWYSVTNAARFGSPSTASVVLAAGATSAWNGISVTFTDSATVNQDACKDATLTITYTAS